MKKFHTVTVVSTLALMMSLTAHAADISTTPAAPKDNAVISDVKSGLNKANDAIVDTAGDIKAFFIGKDSSNLEPVLIHRSLMAHGLIGQPLVNADGKKVATVQDIIVDKNGKAILVVVSDNGTLGIGKKVAAFEYDKTVTEDSDGKVTMALSSDMIAHAADFSYDQRDWAKAKVIPTGSTSVSKLLKGDVLDNNGKKVASIENIYLRNSDVSQIIVGFDKTLGMGGSLAALDYDDLQMVKKKHDLDFKLTANQTAQFNNFKKSVAN